jgi:Tol biopolymer transport system component
VPFKGGPTQRVTQNDEDERSLDWSPDGRLIAFARGSFSGLGSSIYVIRPDGTGERRLSLLTSVDHPSWQPLP